MKEVRRYRLAPQHGVLVLPPGRLADGSGRRALTKEDPEALLYYDEFTRAEVAVGDLIEVPEPAKKENAR